MSVEISIVSQYFSHHLTDDQILERRLVLYLKPVAQGTSSSRLEGG